MTASSNFQTQDVASGGTIGASGGYPLAMKGSLKAASLSAGSLTEGPVYAQLCLVAHRGVDFVLVAILKSGWVRADNKSAFSDALSWHGSISLERVENAPLFIVPVCTNPSGSTATIMTAWEWEE